ncbi:hypothetical protein FOA52_013473 [Chlamydomonas sp. UWO 241]|nr:hypothetical protein FOA52_013473 [Chlamydomonas sp. UWO 241]
MVSIPSLVAGTAADPLAGHPSYELIDPISSGTFGFVLLYLHKPTGERVAVKFLERGDKVSKYVEGEVLNHRMLRHPHVIEFKEVFLTPRFICIAMEYASGHSLFDYVRSSVRLHEAPARWFFQQLICGVDYCHRVGVVNRDVKLENTLLQVVPDFPLPLLKICDFGYSKAQFMSAPKSKVGTLAYMAPEVVFAQTTTPYDGVTADIWSCGIMLYVMLFGAYPFDTPAAAAAAAAAPAGARQHQDRQQTIMANILAMRWAIPKDAEVSPECLDLLSRLIVADPAQRLNMAQIQAHPWFLTNLPPEALNMNDTCIASADYSGVQSVEDIQQMLRSAAVGSSGAGGPADADADEDLLIDEMCAEELAMSDSAMGGSSWAESSVKEP